MLSFWYQFIRVALEKEPLHDFCCSYCLFLLYFGQFPYYMTDFSSTCSKWLGFNEKHDWPIPCDKRLSKTELTKHVDDSLHWRLVSNCYRRLQRNSVTSISFQQKHTVYFLGTITLSSPIKCFWQAMYSVCFVFHFLFNVQRLLQACIRLPSQYCSISNEELSNKQKTGKSDRIWPQWTDGHNRNVALLTFELR